MSQRRKEGRAARSAGEGVDLSHQDQTMDDRHSWVTGDQHARTKEDYEDEDDEDDVESAVNGEQRGREEVAA